ncbi:MAG: transposase [Pseudomonadota bacterium]
MHNHRGHTLRKGRHSEAGRTYAVTTVTHDRQAFFTDWRTGRIVVHEMAQAHAKTLAFVVMPDHVHWLLELHTTTLERLMQTVKSRSAIAVNKRLQQTGPVWQRGFYDHALRKEEDLAAIARYIVANPLRAGLVKKLGDYPLWDAIWL